MSEKFTVMTVCTGNICRSPAMGRMLAHIFAAEPQIEVISGGTYAHDGEDMQPLMKKRVAAYGADVEDFVAEQVTPEMVRTSDLILAATKVHVEDMLAEVPQAQDRTFTLPEFARLLRELSAEDLEEIFGQSTSAAEKLAALTPVLAEPSRRGEISSGEDEIVDPYMLPESVYEESFRQIREPIEALATALSLNY